MSKTIKFDSLTLPEINKLFLSSKFFYVSKRYYGTKISVWTDDNGKIKKMSYKGHVITEADIILNKNVWRLVNKLEDYKNQVFEKNIRFYFTVSPNLQFYSENQKLTGITEIEKYRLPTIFEPIKSKKVAINFIKNQFKSHEQNFDEIVIGIYSEKTKYTLSLNDKKINPEETVDSSYVILGKTIISETSNYILENSHRFYLPIEDDVKRKIELIKMICIENGNPGMHDKNLIYVCGAFSKKMNLGKISTDILKIQKSYLFCYLVNLFVRNNKLPIRSSDFITESDIDKYNFIKDRLNNSYKELY